MSEQDLQRGIEALEDEAVRVQVADGDVAAAGDLDLTDEERELLVAAASDEAEVVGYAINAKLPRPAVPKPGGIFEITQDVTVNKAKTADKAFQAMSNYIKG